MPSRVTSPTGRATPLRAATAAAYGAPLYVASMTGQGTPLYVVNMTERSTSLRVATVLHTTCHSTTRPYWQRVLLKIWHKLPKHQKGPAATATGPNIKLYLTSAPTRRTSYLCE